MAKVSLRIYNREIETMVDRGQLDEAIAHCRHILNTFPKNLETYRLLGKAYLEARRYNEATDIFERVLMAVPDDFVAHVGMSIISDEQSDMDAAIWHMERAFEVQPSNAAIQAELQRLFGRRDGVEPPKIRLNRGALAHMYIQGELYPQAIAEIKAVLEEDRERQDMQVLLARAYYHAGQKGEAAEICAQLLKRYPYCLEANRVLIELLPESERGESPQAYRNRVNELDPYTAFVTSSVFHTEEVPDAAVSLERLEWDGQPVDLGPEWKATQGIGLPDEEPEEEEPDWLKAGLAAGSFAASSQDEGPASASEDDDIPDFLREAGWGKDTGTFKEGSGTFDASGETSEEPELAEGDLPDWIKAMAPTGADVDVSAPQHEEDLSQDDVPDWLQGIGSAQETSLEEQPVEEGEVPDWLAAMKPEAVTPQEQQPEQETTAEPTSEEDLPDWIAALKSEDASAQEPQTEAESMSEPVSEEELPDWIADLKSEDVTPQSAQQEGEPMAVPASEEDLPDWIAALKPTDAALQEEQPEEEAVAKPASEEELPDWLAAMKQEEPAPKGEQLDEEGVAEPASDEEFPDWIAALKSEEVASQEEQPQEEIVAELSDDEDLPDWLRTVQAENDVLPEEQKIDEAPEELAQEIPEMSSESLADWQLGEEETVGTVDFDATDTGDLGTTATEQDDAIAWLESLASKHGAKPEELVTDPNARKETAPDWVQKAKAVKEHEPTEPPVSQEELQTEPTGEASEIQPEASVEPEQPSGMEVPPAEAETAVPSADEQDDAIAWLESLAAKHGAKPEELVTDPDARKDTAPDWVQKSAETTGATQPQSISAESETEAVEEPLESTLDWVEPASEDVETPVSELEDTQPHKPVARAETDETGLWLQGLDDEEGGIASEPEATLESEVPTTDEEDVPDWLRELEAERPKMEADVPSEEEAQDVPDWLLGVDSEASTVESTTISMEEVVEEEEILASEQAEQEIPDWLVETEVDQTAEEQLPSTSTSAETGYENASKIDINSASLEVLANLPGIGDQLARDIIAHREAYGAFSSIDDLSNVGGIGQSTIDDLRGLVEFHSDEPDITDWLRSVEEEDTSAEVAETPAKETDSDDLPDWLAGLDEESAQPETSTSQDEDLPEWLRGVDEQEPAHAEPTTPSDWQPVGEEAVTDEAAPEETIEPEPVKEEPQGEAAPPEPVSEPEPTEPPERERYVEPVTRSRSGMTGMLSSSQDPVLTEAQLELTQGNVHAALQSYGKLIKKGKMLDEIIFDLREALYRYPVDVSLMQALGDAYMRANRLQDALDAYTKAEELLR